MTSTRMWSMISIVLLILSVSIAASASESEFELENEFESVNVEYSDQHEAAHSISPMLSLIQAEARALAEADAAVVCTTAKECNGNGVCKSGKCMCIQPYTGGACDRMICPNQCSGTGICNSQTGQCNCYNATMLATIYPTDGPDHEWGFEGADCSLKTCFTDCGEKLGQGRCNKTTGLCQCSKGFWGPEGMHCNSVLCEDNCNNHGFCVDNKCVCDVASNGLSGWGGDFCEKPVCPNHCFEGAGLGKCINAKCVCDPEWYGEDCSLKRCPENYSPLSWIGSPKSMCSGHGTCNNGNCTCSEGFIGADCSKRTCPGLDIHGNNTGVSCSGHGTCQNNGACTCDAGYKGEDCFDRVCTSDCGVSKKRGSCDGETGICRCETGWYGADCSFKRCEDSCNNNGQCLDGACVCNPGFQGLHCETSICGNNCSFAEGQGKCVNNQCVCNAGFNGVECLYKDCPKALNPLLNATDAVTCGGNGICVAGKCSCNSAWTGIDCTTRVCPYNCSSVGTCQIDGTCSCPKGDSITGKGGYSGQFCETGICPANCAESINQGTCVEKQCVCKPGFGLPDCLYKSCPVGIPLLSSPYTKPVSCSGTGKCIKGACVCDPGFTGPNCGNRLCKNNCGGEKQGTCLENGICRCNDHYNGTDCSEFGCPEGCSNHGLCLGDGKCKCDTRWTGEKCEIPRCPNACSLAGECVRYPANATAAAYEKCECDPGFQGADCSQPICLPFAADGTTMCKGKGRCVVDSNGLHVCRCDSPFAGQECGNAVCNNTCSFHGVCTGAKSADAKCECDDGWYGDNCERTGNCDPYDCFGRGKCVAGPKNSPICQCQAPFGGPDCSLCTHNCSGHGSCTSNGCKCEDGWKGALCDRRDDCDPKDCGGASHGTCVADANGQPACKCQYPWTDFDCLQCTLTCNEHGECNDQGKCTCDKGWKGEQCDRYGDCPNNCSDKGQCVGDEIGDPVCKCLPGYAGLDCGSLICNKTCPANSRCLNNECVCMDGWTGDTCQERDDCPNLCNGVGTCMADLQGKPFCKCQVGRGGSACEYQMCTKSCSDHGSCLLIKGEQKCKCDAGYGGDNCEVVDCSIWDNCGGSTHGECGLTAKGVPQCLCSEPYTGTNCTAVKCTTQHCIHGTCANEKCTCESGWKGAMCDFRVPCPAPGCGESGRCVGDANGVGKCECSPGFTGPNCLDIVCEDKCSGHGTCLNNGCICESGYHGEKCEITAPCPNNCNGHGECNYDQTNKTSICDCEDMYDSAEGAGDCSVQRGKTWLDASGKLQYKCLAPYYGNLCQSKGCKVPCKNNGTCAIDGICDCQPGYKGVDCSETVCPNGCNGGGECDLSAKMCRCFYGYSGPACSVYNAEICQSNCIFKCTLIGQSGLVQITDRDGLLHWVSAKECNAMCKLPTLCQVMFGSGHKSDPNKEYATIPSATSTA